jgi:hypothetical protein
MDISNFYQLEKSICAGSALSTISVRLGKVIGNMYFGPKGILESTRMYAI